MNLTIASNPHSARRPRCARRAGRRGFTLLEGMVASVLLAGSTVAISGAMTASYQHDEFSKRQRETMSSARQLLDEIAALPMTPSVAGQLSMADVAAYTDVSSSDATGSLFAANFATTDSTTPPDEDTQQQEETAATSSNSGGLLSGLLGTVSKVVSTILGTDSGDNSGTGSSSSGSGSSGNGNGNSGNGNGNGGPNSSSTASIPAKKKLNRTVNITRQSTLGGSATASGELAVVSVSVKNSEGKTVTFKRLVSSAEAGVNKAVQK